MSVGPLLALTLSDQARMRGNQLLVAKDQDLVKAFVHRHLFPDQALGDRVTVGILCSALHKIPYVESGNMLSKLPADGSNDLDSNRLKRPQR